MERYTINAYEGNTWVRTAWRQCTRQEAITHAESMSERRPHLTIEVTDEMTGLDIHTIRPFPPE